MPDLRPLAEPGRLRIRHLVRSDGFGGVERYLTYVAPELAARGHQVEVMGGDPAPMAEALAGTGVVHVPAAHATALARAAWAGPEPDLFHTHMTAADAVGVAVGRRRRRPVVSTLHFAGGRGHSPATRWAYGWLGRGLAAQLAISQHVADTSTGTTGGPTPGGGIEVVPLGLPDPLGGRAPVPAADRPPVVVVAQRLELEKHTDVALRAWRLSGLGADGWQLVVAGDGSQRGALEDLAGVLAVADSVTFVGHDPDVLTRLGQARVVLAPGGGEGFGLTVVEAMACATPVLAAAGGAHPETVGQDHPDLLFAPDDVVAAGRQLRALALDPARTAELGQALRARFEARFGIDGHVDRLEAVYRRVLEPRAAAR